MLAIRIHTERGESYDRPALGLLSELVARIGADGDRFVIVERLTADPDEYIQVWHDQGDDYQLEHRAGSADRHFRTHLPTPAEVAAVMTRWARDEKDWSAGPTWERLDFPPEEDRAAGVPPLDPQVEQELAEAVRDWLRRGYDGRESLTESAEEHLVEGDVRPVSREQAARLVDRLWRERVAEQAGWEGTTDPERITRAFAALEASGITARENFTCCRGCGLAEIWADGAQDARGFVFFHSQAAQGAAAGEDLFLLYGGFESDEALTVSVGREVVAALTAEGLGWAWGGSAHDAIRVTGLDWRRRLGS